MNPSTSQLHPASFAEFAQEAQRGNVIAVVRTVLAGKLDPIDAFVSVSHGSQYAFLLESVEGGEVVAKYSFLGANPYMIVRGEGDTTTIEREGETERRNERLPEFLRRHFRENKLAVRADLGPLAGGAVGYLGYGAAKWFEPALNKQDKTHREMSGDSQGEDSLLMFYRTLVVFDRVKGQMRIVSVVFTDESAGNEARLRDLYEAAVAETERIANLLEIASAPIDDVRLSNGESFSKSRA
ncbi:MAG TPA: hypothetical protein VGO68_01970, partial [Pyrinomonadaceae bacterium]|nr:hypothetical protein [Pyrinomonadaceae bacterium]